MTSLGHGRYGRGLLGYYAGRPRTREARQAAFTLPLALRIISDVLMALDYVHNLTDEGRQRATRCTACQRATDCPASAPVCSYGFCEAS